MCSKSTDGQRRRALKRRLEASKTLFLFGVCRFPLVTTQNAVFGTDKENMFVPAKMVLHLGLFLLAFQFDPGTDPYMVQVDPGA